MSNRNYKRKYYRIKPDTVICSDMTIGCIESRKVKTGITRVLIRNISPDGLRFSSCLDFPVTQKVLLKFQITIRDKTIELEGHITNKKCIYSGKFEYGVCFVDIDDIKRSYLLNLFNNMIICIQKHIVILRLN